MKPEAKKAGFTVIELLVAITITVVLAGLLISVTSGALDVWQRTQSRLTMNAQVKVALDLLARDLQAVVRPPTADIAFAVDVVPTGELGAHNWRMADPLIKPDDAVSLQVLANATRAEQRITDARFGRSGIWLRMISTNVESGNSLPTALAYQINRRPISGSVNEAESASVRYTLYRTKISSDVAFNQGYDLLLPFYASLSLSPRGALVAPSTDEALCDNVVDFGVWCYVRQPDGSLGDPVYPAGNKAVRYHASGASGAVNPIPDVVDVMLRVLTNNGAERLEQMELGRVTRPPEFASNDAWWWSVVEAESQVFTMRIEVGAAAMP